MKVKELADLIQAAPLTNVGMEQEVTAGFTGDLLSFVMSHCGPGSCWVTVQTHLNVIAVGVLLELSCIIIPDGEKMEQESIDKANEEEIAVLATEKSAFEICGILYQNGLLPSKRI